ncbi:MAG TPA: complex I NDUFA9 subunit family protein [Geobacteraceae bacterium]|nr:complex I NDUFA9 subunit family protein [Geobacteraceae bacterium]
MKLFISGGTGFVGGHLCRELLARGHQLRLLVHSARPSAETGIEYFPGDVTDAQSCREGANGCDAVINLVGIIREFPGRKVTFNRLHVEATANMLAAARHNGVGRYLQMSALGSRPGAVSGYHRSKYSAEELVTASGLDYTIFRPSLIFGPGDAFVTMLAGYIRSFATVPVIGDGAYRLQPIAAADVARCFALALEMPATSGQVYTLCGRDRLTYLELVDAIGRAMGKSFVLKIKNPLSLMKLVTPLLEGFSFFPLTTDQITMLLEESICDGSWQETFGFEPVGFAEGIGRYL